MRFAVCLLTAFAAVTDASSQCAPEWSSLGGLDGWGNLAFAVFDEDGDGPRPPALFTGPALGDILGVTRWDGWQASPVGDKPPWGTVRQLEVVPDHEGSLQPGLYAGGNFETAAGVTANNLARWDGVAWHEVGGGVTQPPGIAAYVFAMQVFDEDGEGPAPPALFVGGKFERAGGVPVQSLARWDGREWSNVGGGLSSGGLPTVYAMTVYDDGRGPALFVGGNFTWAGGERALNVARWDGHNWEQVSGVVGGGLNGSVHSLCSFDEDGSGAKPATLFAGGQFSSASLGTVEVIRIARWDGVQWSAVGGWNKPGVVWAMTVWDEDGPGAAGRSLYIGGSFNSLPDGTPCNKLARWDGENWHTVGGGVSGWGPSTSVDGLLAFDEDGPGPNPGGLYIGGLFSHAGGVPAKHIARWGCPLPPTPPCYADCDGSGSLEFFDFLCFQNLFAALDPGADCDGDGAHTFFDFLCFQNAFAAGCP